MNIRTEISDIIRSDAESNYRLNAPVGIKITKLNKSFGSNHVLRDLNLEVKPSETLVVIGKTGSGKSVLLRHIIGLEGPDSGEILINGMDVNDPEVRKKHRFAMVFQSSALFNSLTVAENITLYLREHKVIKDENAVREIVSNTLNIVGLEGKENIMPSELSGGMKKRVAIARALAMNPDLILVDEPTSELDPMMARTIGDAILNLRKHVEVTQIVVTHDIDLAYYIADRIAVLDEGQIIEVGTPQEIDRSANPLVRKFITTQFEREEGGRRL
ncbi:MAG TPA: ATP-binding cassette domain-containing protein [Thermodesulfobacteriota bacterium]|nr:ATP-binding cassette domain-containing protein [Thermodesulfobacteriota bacterium]